MTKRRADESAGNGARSVPASYPLSTEYDGHDAALGAAAPGSDAASSSAASSSIDARHQATGTAAPGFEELFRDKFGVMVSVARLMGSDDPENTAQEAFVRLHGAWPTLRDPASAAGYLRRVVVNLTKNRKRHLAVARDHAPRQAAGGNASSAAETTPGTDYRIEPSAESDTLRHTRSDEILAALAGLDADRRAAVVLRFWHDLKYDDIARALQCPPATARSHVRRALKDLKPVLTERGETP